MSASLAAFERPRIGVSNTVCYPPLYLDNLCLVAEKLKEKDEQILDL